MTLDMYPVGPCPMSQAANTKMIDATPPHIKYTAKVATPPRVTYPPLRTKVSTDAALFAVLPLPPATTAPVPLDPEELWPDEE